MILHTCILYVLRFLAGIKSETWEKTLVWVREAEHDITALTDGSQRREWVAGQLKAAAPTLGQWVVDLLVGLAAGYAGRRGWIHLSR